MSASAGNGTRSVFRLESGLDMLEQWEEKATQPEKNMMHRALFAVVDRTVFSEYLVVDDVSRTMEFFVLVRGDLTLKVRVLGLDAFGIVYVGPTSEAPDLDRARPVHETFAVAYIEDLLGDSLGGETGNGQAERGQTENG